MTVDTKATRRPAAALLLFLVAACTAVDRPVMSEFRPLGENRFDFTAQADAVYPEDSPGAEATRMEWLQQYLRDNGGCPDTYRIVDRKVVLVQKALLGDIKRIYYTVECPA